MRACRITSSLVLGLLLSAVPAAALDSLLGEWEGTLKCTTTVAGVVSKTKVAETVLIGNVDGALAIVLTATDLTLLGSAIPDVRSDATGVVSAASCGFGVAELTGGALRGQAKTKAGSDKASLKLELILMELPTATSSSCRLTAKRVSAVPPKAPVCDV